MTLTIELDEEMETRLQEVARLRGTDLGGYVRQLLAQSLPDDGNAALLRLFAEWDREDGALSEDELEAERAEWDEIRANLDRRRIELRPLRETHHHAGRDAAVTADTAEGDPAGGCLPPLALFTACSRLPCRGSRDLRL